MKISEGRIKRIEETIRNSLRNRFENYNPEPASMPFHTRLLGKDRLALYSFIHSLATNFGEAIFEPVAVELATGNFDIAKTHQIAGDLISEKAQIEIQKIMDGLSTANLSPNKPEEIEKIRKVGQEGKMMKVKPTRVDIFLKKGNTLFFFDIKTAKPNAGGFREFKRTLLEWVAVVFAQNPKAIINTMIAIPYNPYEPQPYNRWTMRGMLDLEQELKVASEFWDFLGGEGAYQSLLDCFEKVGVEMRQEIDNYFSRFNK